MNNKKSQNSFPNAIFFYCIAQEKLNALAKFDADISIPDFFTIFLKMSIKRIEIL